MNIPFSLHDISEPKIVEDEEVPCKYFVPISRLSNFTTIGTARNTYSIRSLIVNIYHVPL